MTAAPTTRSDQGLVLVGGLSDTAAGRTFTLVQPSGLVDTLPVVSL